MPKYNVETNNINIPPSIQILRCIANTYGNDRKMVHITGREYDDIVRDIRALDKEEYKEYVTEVINNSVEAIGGPKSPLYSIMNNIYNAINTVYVMNNEINILLSLKSDKLNFGSVGASVKNYNLDAYYDDIKDFRLSFELKNGNYSPVSVQIIKRETSVEIDNITYDSYLSFCVMNNERNLCEFIYVKGIKNTVFIPDTVTLFRDRCKGNCGKCSKTNFVHINKKMKVRIVQENLCKVSKERLELEHCNVNKFNPFRIMSICAYAWDMYSHRKNINRKNSPTKKAYTDSNITLSVVEPDKSTPFSNEITYSIIKLNKYYEWEKSEKNKPDFTDMEETKNTGSTHSHHKSPREHERTGYWGHRWSKEGLREVYIPPTTVNKGKKDNNIQIYKVSI